jgi:hypothetical protein
VSSIPSSSSSFPSPLPRWNQRQRAWYRRGPHSTTKTTVGGYRPPLLDDDEPHPYDDDDGLDESLDDDDRDGQSKKFFKLRRRQVWENDVLSRNDGLKSEKRGGRAYRPERNKNRYRRAMEKQAFIRENNGERRRNLAKKRAEESKKVEEKWRSMRRFAQEPDLLTLEQCASCKKMYAKHEGECKKCTEKNDEESVFSM